LKFAVETGELGPEALRPVPTLAIRPGHILLGGLSRQSRWLAVTGPNHTWVWWIERIVVGYGTLLLLASAAWMMCRGSGATAVSNHDHAQTGYVSRPLGEIARTMWIGLALLTQVMLTILIVRYYMTMDDAGIYPIYASILYPSGVYFILLLQLPQTRHWFLSPGNLATATHILLETLDAEAKENTSWFRKNQTIAQVFTDTDPASGKTKRWFQYLCVRYVWSEQEQMFLPAGKAHFDGPIPTTGLDSKTVQDLVTESPNVIDVAVPSVLQALAIEFSGAFYVFQLMACWLAFIWSAWNEGLVFMFMGFTTGIFHGIFVVRAQQVKVQEMARFDEPVTVLRDGKWGEVSSTQLVPGDVIKPATGTVACDCVLVSGGAVSSEAMLTGEPMPVQKFPLEGGGPISSKHKKHLLFAGTNLLQISDAVAVVNATGAMTAKGQLVRMVLFPSPVKFKFTSELPYVIGILSVYGFSCLVTISIFLGSALDGLSVLFSGTFFVLQALSPLLPVSLSAGQSVAAGRLTQQTGVQCLSPPRITVAGELHVFVFDKTGTLTEDGMSLVGVREGLGKLCPDFLHAGPMWPTVLASCHTVGKVGEQTVGPELEVRMLEASGYSFGPGPGRTFVGPAGERIEVVRALEFDHDRMTSGALVRAGDKIFLMLKGSYERIESLCTVPQDYKAVTTQIASENFYVLGVAYREVSEAEIQKLAEAPRAEVEKNLKFLGLLQFRNELKPDSASAIAALREGQIRTVMCTGDNVYTGVAIGKQCGLVPEGASVVIGDAEKDNSGASVVVWRDETGATVKEGEKRFVEAELAVTGAALRVLVESGDLDRLLLQIRVFGRVLPDQKVQVVNAHQAQDFVTGMCGDGGNDCAALRAAHVGVALSEAEASIVAPFSSGANKSCHAVVEVAKMGRACLTTNLASYRFFIVCGLTVTTWKVAQLSFGGFYPSEWQFLFMDILAPVVFTWTMTVGCCYAASTLAPSRPSSSLFGSEMILAILVPHAFFCIAYAIVWSTLERQPWFVGYSEEFLAHIYDHATPLAGSAIMLTGDNYIAASVFLIVCVHLTTVALAFSRGGKYRRPVYHSWQMVLTTILVLGFVGLLCYTGPNSFTCLFRVNCSNEVAQTNYVPVATEFSTTTVPGRSGNCFFGPQGGAWLDDGFGMEYPNCFPAAGANLDSIEGSVGPNNIFPQTWRYFLTGVGCTLGLFTILFINFGLDGLATSLEKPLVMNV
jgi:cation-transporting ATPase 13A3/4/5